MSSPFLSISCSLHPVPSLPLGAHYYLLVSPIPLSYGRHASAACSTSISPLRSATSRVFSVGLNRVSLGAPSDPFMPCSQSAITPKMIMQGPCQPHSCFCTLLPALLHPPLSRSPLPYAPFSFLSTHPFCQRLIGLEMIRFILDVNAVIMLLLEKKRKKNYPPHALKPNLK